MTDYRVVDWSGGRWLKRKCPRPNCGGNLYTEKEEGKLIYKCFACSRSWTADGMERALLPTWLTGEQASAIEVVNESRKHPDIGCKVAAIVLGKPTSKCTECPFPPENCRDIQSGKDGRNLAILKLHQDGKQPVEIAQAVGLSPQRVRTIIRESRER